jgi:hypothetical protein
VSDLPLFFLYKFFIYTLFACFICSASEAVNEGPSVSERGCGRQPTERGGGRRRGRLAAWFRFECDVGVVMFRTLNVMLDL